MFLWSCFPLSHKQGQRQFGGARRDRDLQFSRYILLLKIVSGVLQSMVCEKLAVPLRNDIRHASHERVQAAMQTVSIYGHGDDNRGIIYTALLHPMYLF